MNKRKHFVSLNLKMAWILLLGLLLMLCVYVLCNWLTSYICEVQYTGDAAVKRNVDEAYDSLEAYVARYHVKATDSKALYNWAGEQKDTYILVYDNYSNVFETGWWISADENAAPTEEMNEDADDVIEGKIVIQAEEDLPRIDEAGFARDVKNRIVDFADGKYYTFIEVYGEQRVQEIMRVVTLALCFLTLMVTLLIYHNNLINRIILLSAEVEKISAGDLSHIIRATRNDEIGSLAVSVDNMRTSIIQKHRSEREAWEANNQLITSMSHDIRTPLTSMIGYLDIIEGKKYTDQTQLDRYIASCREKAFQLKDLSDKLFQYFLVFGNQDANRNMETHDASILFQQLLTEHCAEIISYGYTVNFTFALPEVKVRTDVSGLRRLFDNLFSNIMKYADKKQPVDIEARLVDDTICLSLGNQIPQEQKKVESTRIGLKTCEKICSDLSGSFVYRETETAFRADITFPVWEEPPAPEGADAAETADSAPTEEE